MQRVFSKAEILAPAHKQLDITNQMQVADFFQTYRPDVVLHCAAYNNVDLAETELAQCRNVNVIGTRNIAEASRQCGAYMVYTSSDYVFDGEKNGEYQITDKKHPLSVYGVTKSEAEDIVLSNPQNAVLRISWLFGPGNHNFVKAVLRTAQSRDRLNVVGDQVGSPTYTEDLAVLIQEILQRRPAGILHGTNGGECSRAEFAKEILRISHSGTVVKEVTSQQYPSKARRPLNSRLSKASLDAAGLHRLPDWKDALARYLVSDD